MFFWHHLIALGMMSNPRYVRTLPIKGTALRPMPQPTSNTVSCDSSPHFSVRNRRKPSPSVLKSRSELVTELHILFGGVSGSRRPVSTSSRSDADWYSFLRAGFRGSGTLALRLCLILTTIPQAPGDLPLDGTFETEGWE